MSWTDAENNRVLAIEQLLNTLQTTANNLVSKQQVRQLLLSKQAEIDNLTERVAELEQLIQIIQSNL
jgi:hypothetical protein